MGPRPLTAPGSCQYILRPDTFLPVLLQLLERAGEDTRDRGEVWALVLLEGMGKTEEVGL